MIFETVNASFSYKKNSAMLLKNINLNVESNEVLAILGPNGIGKTTLLKCMTGLLHWKEGFSSIDKRRVDEMSSKDFFQSPPMFLRQGIRHLPTNRKNL